MRAIWNDTVIVESNDTVVVEGNHCFPLSSLVREHVAVADRVAFWKGVQVGP